MWEKNQSFIHLREVSAGSLLSFKKTKLEIPPCAPSFPYSKPMITVVFDLAASVSCVSPHTSTDAPCYTV